MKSLQTIIFEKLKLADIKNFENEYFYHEALETGYTTKFSNTGNVLQYSIDNCKKWYDLKPNTETPKINKGQCIYFKGERMIVDNDGIGVFESNKKFNVGGNIMSLIYGDNFNSKIFLLKDNQFKRLFCYNKNLISGEYLVLPAIELTAECYDSMFKGCTSLIEAPKLPATKLANGCYWFMFDKCTSLTKAPELPAMELSRICYKCMFIRCKSLIEAPKLPATELASGCYEHMFGECESLKEAPELHAKKLVEYCYECMFEGCTSLNKITMLAKNISGLFCLFNWTNNVSSSGTFTKAKGVDIPAGIEGIPTGWTVKEI